MHLKIYTRFRMKQKSILLKVQLNKLQIKFVSFYCLLPLSNALVSNLCAILSYSSLYATFLLFVLCSLMLYLLSVHFLCIDFCCLIISLRCHSTFLRSVVYFPQRHAVSFTLPFFISSEYFYNPEKHTQDTDKWIGIRYSIGRDTLSSLRCKNSWIKKIKGTELEAYHSPPPSVDVKNA